MLWDFRPLQPPDFGPLEPDSTVPGGLDLGIVETTLGADDTPAYAGDPTTPSTNGAADFFEWYHDSPASLNTTIPLAFGPLPGDPTTFASNNPTFFPVDSELFGNEGPGSGPGPEHNYYFTVAFELTFRYRGGETFRFASDDDSWVFINRTLAVNLGGIHPTIHLAISLDELSTQLGITLGQTYPMHVFYADRRPIEAVLDMEVPAVDFAVCSDGGLP
jgi:fibro-slime domain-containing protein